MKTACIYHSIDLDGWMSAAIVKYWWHTSPDALDNNDDKLDFIGYNYGDPIPDVSEYDRVIMCDISFPNDKMFGIVEILGKELIWIDHHISAIKDNVDVELVAGLRNTNFAACELTWKYFFPNNPMPEIVRLLGRYDCFGHKETDEEQKVLEFQYGARQCISNYNEAYNYLLKSFKDIINYDYVGQYTIEDRILEQGKSIYQYLCTEAKQTYKNGFEINLKEPFVGLWGSGKDDRKFICINKERFNPINFGIDYHKDGYDGCACFHYANGMWNFSLYNDNGLVDCSAIAKQYGGGGHKGASGFRTNNIEQFIRKNL